MSAHDEAPPGPPGTNFAEIARTMAREPTVARTLQRIVELAIDKIDGCDAAGILLLTKGEIVAGAWSDERVRAIEEMECALGEGPCLDAITENRTFESPDLRDHLSRWPTFAARAIDAGIHSMLAFRLFAAEDTLGALDLYGYQPHAFDEVARAFGAVFAAHAALALAGAQLHEHDLATADDLRAALETRDVIGQAKGILMATHHIDDVAAFNLLCETSSRVNRKLRNIADDVTRTGTLPDR
jgi:transcriptional regulator with GAF, ATPase, and Fis domain